MKRIVAGMMCTGLLTTAFMAAAQPKDSTESLGRGTDVTVKGFIPDAQSTKLAEPPPAVSDSKLTTSLKALSPTPVSGKATSAPTKTEQAKASTTTPRPRVTFKTAETPGAATTPSPSASPTRSVSSAPTPKPGYAMTDLDREQQKTEGKNPQDAQQEPAKEQTETPADTAEASGRESAPPPSSGGRSREWVAEEGISLEGTIISRNHLNSGSISLRVKSRTEGTVEVLIPPIQGISVPTGNVAVHINGKVLSNKDGRLVVRAAEVARIGGPEPSGPPPTSRRVVRPGPYYGPPR